MRCIVIIMINNQLIIFYSILGENNAVSYKGRVMRVYEVYESYEGYGGFLRILRSTSMSILMVLKLNNSYTHTSCTAVERCESERCAVRSMRAGCFALACGQFCASASATAQAGAAESRTRSAREQRAGSAARCNRCEPLPPPPIVRMEGDLLRRAFVCQTRHAGDN